jgi:hypothetical protein
MDHIEKTLKMGNVVHLEQFFVLNYMKDAKGQEASQV